jgi:uncharacterized protein (TIGR02594 family)
MGKIKNPLKELVKTNKGLALILEARKWIGTTEVGGNNKGPSVEAFQKAVDGKAQGEPWCMAFVQFCVQKVAPSLLASSEHCLTVWNRTPREQRLEVPEPGCIMIWRHKGTDQGHCGIVSGFDGVIISTIEGNTAPHRRDVEREGDGVYEVTRSMNGTPTMDVVGWLRPWQEA